MIMEVNKITLLELWTASNIWGGPNFVAKVQTFASAIYSLLHEIEKDKWIGQGACVWYNSQNNVMLFTGL